MPRTKRQATLEKFSWGDEISREEIINVVETVVSGTSQVTGKSLITTRVPSTGYRQQRFFSHVTNSSSKTGPAKAEGNMNKFHKIQQ
jgi:Tfp pilus assembly major pilin PilA